LEAVLLVSHDLLKSAKFAAVVSGLGSELEVDLQVDVVDLEFELGVVLETMTFDDSAAVENPQHYCSEEV